MADQVVKTITIRGQTQGVNEATDALKKLADAQGAVATVSDTSSKSSLSLEQAYNRQTMRLDAAARQQAAFSREANIANGALAQGVITTQEHAARMDLLSQKYAQGGTFSQAFGKALSGVQGQLVALSAGAGPVGVFLSALGPWGVAAAVGIGGAHQALNMMSDAAHGLAQKAEELRRFSEATGLTTDQVQALRGEASKFGLTGEEVATAVQNFTARFNELRMGQGDLLTQIRRINPALAEQMAGATSASQAMTLFGQSLDKVDNVFQRNALMKAAVGRGGVSMGQFFQGINVDQLTNSFRQVGHALDDDLIQKLATLEVQIEKTSHKARDNIASIFAAPVLEAELKFVQSFEHFTEILRDFKTGGSWSKFISDINSSSFVNGAMVLLSGGAAAPRLFMNKPSTGPSGPAAGGSGLGLRGGSPEAAGASTGPTPQFLAETLRAQIGAMGDAATFAQKLSLAQQELAIKGHDAGLSQDQLAKAERVLTESSDLQRLQARIGLLGDLATVGDHVRAIQERVDLERAKGVQISNDEAAAIARSTAVKAESAKLQTQAQFGIYDATRQNTNAQLELQTLIDSKAIKSSDDYAAALTVVSKRLKDTSDAAQVARSNLPQLTQLMLDAGNKWKQLDTLGTTGLNDFNNSLLDFETGTKTGADAMKDFEQKFIRSLLNMVNQMLIIQPIAMALRGALDFGGGGFFGSMFGGGLSGAGKGIISAHTGGVVGSDSFASAYVHPAYFDGASRFADGGIAGLGPDEVPIVAHKNEEIIRPDDPRHRWNGGAGAGQTIKQEVTFNVNGAMTKREIAQMISVGMAQATGAAVGITSASVGDRQQQMHLLGK